MAPLVLALRLGRTRHLKATPGVVWLVSGLGSAATVTLCSLGMLVATPLVAYGAALIVGGCAGVLWVLWGERLACQKARFTLVRVAPTYGGFLLVLLGLTYVAPGWFAHRARRRDAAAVRGAPARPRPGSCPTAPRGSCRRRLPSRASAR